MIANEGAIKMDEAWAPYTPTPEAPWDRRRVVHLHRRAGLAATWEEAERDLADGPEASVSRLLDGKSRAYGVPTDFDSTASLLADAAVASNDPARLKAWWFYRMMFGPDPLGERLTLMWHDHFATSNLKVDNLAAMKRQNELFRTHGRDRFATLLGAVVHDPALLIWLDAPANRKGHPNENLARELMELFTLGIGHYTEPDIKEAARALTGWTLNDGAFRPVATRHDPGEKSILGRKGTWSGDDLLKILLEQPAAAEHLAKRLCRTFLGEKSADAAAIASLAEFLRRNQLDIGKAVATILRSRRFFDESNIQARVLGPIEYVLGPIRAFEMLDPPPSTLVLADWAARLGQDLFYPPNVGGWPGGRGWLSSRAVIGRANFAASLVDGRGIGRPTPVDLLVLAEQHERARDRDGVIAFCGELLLGSPPSQAWHDRIAAALGPDSSWGPDLARRAAALIVASPEAQLQ
ncbi:DUF1800 domain-containing protein [Singulisphaera sp. PoT]|uniref:DUF1800 domain-containing protein n=1 Tax=Singulisphaera sp. PoT TaxID=3411797 RepID=UPI003BF4F12B